MKILYIMPWIRQGGAEVDAVYSAHAMSRRGHTARLACLFVNTSLMSPVASQIEYVLPPQWLSCLLERSHLLVYVLGPWVLLFMVLRYGREYDVLHPHSYPAPWVTVAARWLLGRRCPSIFWLCNEPPHALPLSELPKIGLLDWLMWRILDSPLDRLLCSPIEHITVYSHLVREQVRQRYKRGSTMIRLGLDYDFFSGLVKWDFRRQYHLEGKFVLLMVGRMHPQKNQLLALRLVKQLREDIPGVYLVLVGTGQYENYLKKVAVELEVADRVLFFGVGSAGQVRDWYYACDLVLYPSVDQAPPVNQSWGLVPFEALCAGKLSVVSAGTGAAEVLVSERIGLVAQPTVDAFASKVREYYAQPEKFAEWVGRGQCFVREQLSWERYAKELEEWLSAGIKKTP